MLPPETSIDWASVEVAASRPSDRLPGIAMAGFNQPASPRPVDIAVVPYPAVTLFLDLTEGDALLYDSGGRRTHGSVVVGLFPGELRAAGRRLECLQIRLDPVTAARVLGASADLIGAVVSLHDLWGHDAERAEDLLRAAPSWPERFAIATELLGRRQADRSVVDPEVAHSWRRTVLNRGQVRIDGLAGDVGWSRKRLWSRFRSQLGISPKRAAKLVRFDQAAHLLARGSAPVDAAFESGYVDQSHLHREVQAFTGLTPAALAVAPWLAIDPIAWPRRGGPRSRR